MTSPGPTDPVDGQQAARGPRIRARLAGQLAGHSATPWRVCFSPDSRLLLTGAEDDSALRYEIGLWDVEQRALIRLLDTPGYSPTFAPDGRAIAFGSMDGGRVLLADLQGRILGELSGHARNAVGIVFSPDGSLLATGDTAGDVRLWDVATRTLRVVFPAQQQPAAGLIRYGEPRGFSADGRWLFVDAPDQLGAAQLFEITRKEDGAVEAAWRGAIGVARASLSASAFAPHGRLLALATDHDAGLLLLRLPSFEQALLPAFADAIQDTTRALAFSPDSLWLAEATTAQGRVALWEVLSGELGGTWEAHTDFYRGPLGGDQMNSVYDLAWAPSGHYLATAGPGIVGSLERETEIGGRRVGQPVDLIRLWEVERDPPWPALPRASDSSAL